MGSKVDVMFKCEPSSKRRFMDGQCRERISFLESSLSQARSKVLSSSTTTECEQWEFEVERLKALLENERAGLERVE